LQEIEQGKSGLSEFLCFGPVWLLWIRGKPMQLITRQGAEPILGAD
jgi:hypothetical protein